MKNQDLPIKQLVYLVIMALTALAMAIVAIAWEQKNTGNLNKNYTVEKK